MHSNKKKRLKLQARTSESVNGGQGGKTYLLGAKSRWPSIPNDARDTSACGMTCTYHKMRRLKHWSLPRRLCWWLGYQRVVAVVDSEQRVKKTGSVTVTQKTCLFFGIDRIRFRNGWCVQEGHSFGRYNGSRSKKGRLYHPFISRVRPIE